ncbi:hypothetical protein P4S73_13870 [Paraglaciecola sp. Hal342]
MGKLSKKADRALGVHGISLSEFMVLHHLNYAQNQVMSRTELADAVNLTSIRGDSIIDTDGKNSLG